MNAFFRIRDLEEFSVGNRSSSRLVIMIRAAFDASMDDPCGITAVGGYIGSTEQWQRIEEKWLVQLELERLKKFRLTDVFQEHLYERALDITLGFAKILSQSGLRSVFACLLDTDWALLDKDSEYLRIFPQRQHACLDMLLGVLGQEMDLQHKGLPLAVVFDNDYGNTEMAARVYENWRTRTGHPGFSRVAFQKGSAEWDVVPLQCADLLAGVVRKNPSSKEDLLKAFSGREQVSSSTKIGLIASRAMANGRSSMWSIAMAKDIEEIKRRNREAEA